jgi:hypothetical protein
MPYRFHVISRDKLKKDSDACIYEIKGGKGKKGGGGERGQSQMALT